MALRRCWSTDCRLPALHCDWAGWWWCPWHRFIYRHEIRPGGRG